METDSWSFFGLGVLFGLGLKATCFFPLPPLASAITSGN